MKNSFIFTLCSNYSTSFRRNLQKQFFYYRRQVYNFINRVFLKKKNQNETNINSKECNLFFPFAYHH